MSDDRSKPHGAEPDEFGETTVVTAVSGVGPIPEASRRAAMLVVLSGPAIGRNYALDSDKILIGRSGDVNILIPDEGVSRVHAEIQRDGDEFVIVDHGSMNGTAVDGKRLVAPTRLQDGARILVGSRTIVKFSLMDNLEAEAQRRVTDAVYRDGLTGVFNRRYLDIRLKEEFAFASRHGRPVALLLVDVDHFKNVNDTYGHQSGDEILKALAQCLEKNVRIEDVVARYGGEEFVIIARGINLAQSKTFAERVCGFVRGLRVPCGPAGEKIVSLTVSIGCACYRVDRDESIEAVLARADAALYAAKHAGRDRVGVGE
jgi:diguanylate cyclase (GGDEF)-like protein